jgi:hypothetical protein
MIHAIHFGFKNCARCASPMRGVVHDLVFAKTWLHCNKIWRRHVDLGFELEFRLCAASPASQKAALKVEALRAILMLASCTHMQ